MTIPRWPVVVFDLDGTLCNTVPLIIASHQHAMRSVYRREIDEATARSWIGLTLMDCYARFVERDALIDAYTTHNLRHIDDPGVPFEGVAELLDELAAAGVRVGVATSKRRHSAERSMAASGISGKAVLVSTLEDSDVHKPNPAPLLVALTAMDADSKDAVYVGDAVYDIRAARSAGMAQIAVTWGAGVPAELAEEQPTAIAADVDALTRILLPGSRRGLA